MRVRCAITLSLIGTPEGLWLYDGSTQRRWEASPLSAGWIAKLLLWCTQWQDVNRLAAAVHAIAGIPPGDVIQAIREFVEEGLLSVETPAEQSAADHERRWHERGWAAPFTFHTTTNRIRKMDYATDPNGVEDKNLMRRFLDTGSPPSAYREVAGAAVIELERPGPPNQRINLDEVFADKDAWRTSSHSMSFHDFSALTYYCFGQTGSRRLPVTGVHITRTSPSGGSRHPTETHAVVLSVSGVPPGLYHYNVRRHALESLRPGDFTDLLRQHVFTHPTRPDSSVMVVFLLSTLFERSMWRYREARSYRVVHYDLGHLLQTTAYVTKALGLSCYRAYSFHDSVVDDFLGLDTLTESAMAYAAVGQRG